MITHAVDAVDKWVVTGVAHGQPVEQKEQDVDILEPGHKRTISWDLWPDDFVYFSCMHKGILHSSISSKTQITISS